MDYKDFKDDYPKSEIRDFIKTIFQGFMGPAHLVENKDKVVDYLFHECSDLIVDGYINVEFEYLSDKYYRMHFVKDSVYMLKIETIANMFIHSSKQKEDLEGLKEALSNLIVPGADQLFIEEYLEDVRAISHSDIYRESYNPRYRVISSTFFKFANIFSRIDEGLKVVNIDGNSGSGKSTLANILSEIYDCDVIHADDFYLQDHQRTDARLEEVGGNIDYERLNEEVINKLKTTVEYRKFNCMTKAFSKPIKIKKDLLVIEGSYSSHPIFGDYSDLRVFLSIDKERQYKRILARNGEKLFERFKNEWIPKEDAYFEKFSILDKSDLTYFV